jgi:hypothetical protein
VNFIFFAALALAFLALGERAGAGMPWGILGVLFLLPLAIGVIFGLAGMVGLVGNRFAPESANELMRTGWGVLMLTLACGMPFVGWFGMLPFIVWLGLGGFILSLFSKEQSSEEALQPALAD